MRDAIREAVDLIGDACEIAEEQHVCGDTLAALTTMVEATVLLVNVLAPYDRDMPLPYPHVLLVLSNGSTLRTTQNSTADIAGLINAGIAKIYQVADLDGVTHHVMVSAILDFYEVTS